jgi:hypothetical protein
MSQPRETTFLIAVTGLGVGLLLFLWNIAVLIKGDVMYQPSPGPLLGLGLGACAAYGAVVLGPIGRALARRLTGGSDDSRDQLLEDVRSALLGVQAELAETHERLDFTERLLAQGRTPDQLPRG